MRWCEGIPEVEFRRLTPAESDRLREIGQGATRPRVVLALAALVALPAGFAVAAWLQSWGLALVALLGFLLLGLPFGAHWASYAWSLGRALAADLQEGTAVVFGGPEVDLVVLPRSGLVVSRGGVPGASARRLRITTAELAPVGAIPEQGTLQTGAGARERVLTHEERTELRDLASTFGRPRSRLQRAWAAIHVGFAITVLVFWLVGISTGGIRPGKTIAALALIGWELAVHLRVRRVRARMRRDAARGLVLQVTSETGTIVEMLPTVWLVWTAGGEPAAWRHEDAAAKVTRPGLAPSILRR